MPRHFMWLAPPFSLAGIVATMILHTPPLSDNWLCVAKSFLWICGFWVFSIICLWLNEANKWESFKEFLDKSINQLKILKTNLRQDNAPVFDWHSKFCESIDAQAGKKYLREFRQWCEIGSFSPGTAPNPVYLDYWILYLEELKERKAEIAPQLKRG